jgi:hypothetical protein
MSGAEMIQTYHSELKEDNEAQAGISNQVSCAVQSIQEVITMDDFRANQKLQSGMYSGGSRWGRPYGCDCCNRGCLKHRKVTQRRLAKARLRRESVKLISEQRNDP